MKEITIIIQHGLVTRVIAEEEVKVIFMNLDGGYEDQKVVMNDCPYYMDEYIADVDKEELDAIKKALRNEQLEEFKGSIICIQKFTIEVNF